MGQDISGVFGGFGLGRNLKRWTRALQAPERVSVGELEEISSRVRDLGHRLDGIEAQARRAILDRADASDGIDRPDQCDWAMRAEPWAERMRPRGRVDVPSPFKLSGGMTLFHDANRSDVSLRQERAPISQSRSRFGLVLEVYRFDGSFISLVQDLPPEAVIGLTLGHYIAVNLRIEREQPVEVYARLNVQHGPNTEQMVRQMEFVDGQGTAEFDLAYSKINEKKIEKAWLDLILEGPNMTRIALWDLTILRAPRADI